MSLKIQISGVTTQEALFVCLKHRVDYIGAVFYGLSPRNISFNHAAEFNEIIPPTVKKVAVVVHPDKQLIKDIKNSFNPDYFQFDDDSQPAELEQIKAHSNINIIKTLYLDNTLDLPLITSYEPYVDGFLFESKANELLYVDQAENSFNWSLLKELSTPKFWILSGGLNKYNLQDAVRSSRAKIISASSTIEGSPGIKDINMLEDFFKAVRNIDRSTLQM